MQKAILLLFSLIGYTAAIPGQDTTVLKRPAYKLTIAVDKKMQYEETLKEGPYLLPDNSLQIYPGEKVYIEIEQEDGTIKNMKAVKENKNPAKTLEVSFMQTTKNNVHESMMLKINNPFSLSLVYEAKIFLFNRNKWVETDVYPVEAGIAGYEIWPDLITSIALQHWSFKGK